MGVRLGARPVRAWRRDRLGECSATTLGCSATAEPLPRVRRSGDLQILAVREGSTAGRAQERRREPVDLGDGVLALEFHSKMNAIGGDTIQMMHAGVKEAAANFAALVVGNDAPNFSAGANLMLLLLEAQEGNWDEIDLMVRDVPGRDAGAALRRRAGRRRAGGLTLGGGCEIALHGDRVQAAAESYIGLVEVGVGLIPGGGGTKEMLARASRTAGPEHRPAAVRAARCSKRSASRKVSTSAARRAAPRLSPRRSTA